MKSDPVKSEPIAPVKEHDHLDHLHAPTLDHAYDSKHYEEEDRQRLDLPKTSSKFSEVHHREKDVDYDYGSAQEELRHDYPLDGDYHHPREEAKEHSFHPYERYYDGYDAERRY